MTDAIEGRWWLDFTHRPPTNPAGNEFILKAGLVTIAETGDPIGSYEIELGLLTITLRMPTIPDEEPWRMEAKLMLPNPDSRPDQLPGVLQAIDPEGGVFSNGPCTLVLRKDDA
ncbi:MAG: hypothetical protein V4610_01710 [Pseudomonadota bacterium]|jgi:hypothetical protein